MLPVSLQKSKKFPYLVMFLAAPRGGGREREEDHAVAGAWLAGAGGSDINWAGSVCRLRIAAA